MNPQNINLLNEIYKNTSMGALSLKAILPNAIEPNLQSLLQNQAFRYKQIKDSAETRLLEAGIAPKEQSALSKAFVDIGMKVNTIQDKSPSHICEVLIEDSTSGIINLTRMLNQNPGADEDVRDQAEKLIDFEHNNINSMKPLL